VLNDSSVDCSHMKLFQTVWWKIYCGRFT